ncbi:AraC family transcriptional regulator [Sphingobium sp. SCG-1]|uniref:AraC family transcriptional regulator n=1 Tax=Sphingobium sp. SCG-1 TaxID=2072936 RepID=UPI0021D53AF0|nr:AraC family transcriptional regulator [Sphingobium sp. SCG-1]
MTLSTIFKPSTGVSTVHTPVTCLILQGAKRVSIGDAVLQYDNSSYFVASLDVPGTGQILEARPDAPYVAVGMRLDRSALAELVATMPTGLIDHGGTSPGRSSFALSAITPDLLDAWARLLALLDHPEDIAALAAAREREILYCLLKGHLGGQLCQMAQEDSRLARIRRTIHWIQGHYTEELRTVRLSEIAGMSVASFHRHFRAATAMSPLQYQKTLRLQAARRFLAAGWEASRAAYSVGYESATQFSREYSRAFGTPPSRDRMELIGRSTSLETWMAPG